MIGKDMPRYYFNVRSHDAVDKDPEGAELPSFEAARNEAVQAAREIIAEKVLSDDVIDGQSFEITAEDGTVLGAVPFRSVLRLD
ncbi:hypothetical protein ABID21_001354 [Pseudorhizobium tarimense]|uniref:DUF6894 domain-containing protein n=1 Tax=Pseudorhizobium tarimense TaxID=1079109 RepID=A0ABV2H3X8_9HYPH|nr:hypothetical protein [Pseudorhizobium tarimense]MCJ8518335.1 hypothetical protein [Pseudorhizobium tarimense]